MTEHERSSFGKWKKLSLFLGLFLIILFITAAIVLWMGGQGVGELMARAQQVPVLSALLPDLEERQAKKRVEVLEQRLQEAEEQLEEKETVLALMEQQLLEKEEEVRALWEQNDELEAELKEKTLTDEEREQKLSELADVYSSMSASRAASILENLTLTEAALVLQRMDHEQQARILARMTPPFAADLTVVLKDFEQVENPDMAALQERIVLLMESVEQAESRISIQKMVSTFEQMAPGQAAQIFTAMEEDPAEFALAVTIMANMGDTPRSHILENMEPDMAKVYVRALAE
ncbi:flagellar motility protein MotE (MotC chaperone) [Caldalkalibacillus uzonensis]|uniref:Flagellar motility protein MotE (MotC chaperone) n=1 Tax=Caldalkalibacillus uzonensis TaxID=353224 RepID=A0ABU0CLH3_9BACI|nr:hypothetical protein [Caldalkalibacillus uzonensis]MDQ0337267.1 flagellar motility protein MotE (MotC chaperone) [Caldalkalibacillus uzonensis]